MALTWDQTAVSDDVKTEADWQITESLIWGSMTVGLREITDANAATWGKRLHMIALVYGSDVKYVIPLAEIKRRVGLRTNATTWTDAQFRTEMGKRLERNAGRLTQDV